MAEAGTLPSFIYEEATRLVREGHEDVIWVGPQVGTDAGPDGNGGEDSALLGHIEKFKEAGGNLHGHTRFLWEYFRWDQGTTGKRDLNVAGKKFFFDWRRGGDWARILHATGGFRDVRLLTKFFTGGMGLARVSANYDKRHLIQESEDIELEERIDTRCCVVCLTRTGMTKMETEEHLLLDCVGTTYMRTGWNLGGMNRTSVYAFLKDIVSRDGPRGAAKFILQAIKERRSARGALGMGYQIKSADYRRVHRVDSRIDLSNAVLLPDHLWTRSGVDDLVPGGGSSSGRDHLEPDLGMGARPGPALPCLPGSEEGSGSFPPGGCVSSAVCPPAGLLRSTSKLLYAIVARRWRGCISLPAEQCGFRGKHSTIDSLMALFVVTRKYIYFSRETVGESVPGDSHNRSRLAEWKGRLEWLYPDVAKALRCLTKSEVRASLGGVCSALGSSGGAVPAPVGLLGDLGENIGLCETDSQHASDDLPVCFSFYGDVRKAFPYMSRRIMMLKFLVMGITLRSLLLMWKGLLGMKAILSVDKEWAGPFDIECGAKEGSIEGPFLWIGFYADVTVFLDWMEQAIQERHDVGFLGGFGIGRLVLKALLYADDTAILAHNPRLLQLRMNIYRVYCLANRITLAEDKCSVLPQFDHDKYVVKLSEDSKKASLYQKVGKNGRLLRHITDYNFRLGGVPVSFCLNFKYLGMQVDSAASMCTPISQQAKSARRAWRMVQSLASSMKDFRIGIISRLFDQVSPVASIDAVMTNATGEETDGSRVRGSRYDFFAVRERACANRGLRSATVSSGGAPEFCVKVDNSIVRGVVLTLVYGDITVTSVRWGSLANSFGVHPSHIIRVRCHPEERGARYTATLRFFATHVDAHSLHTQKFWVRWPSLTEPAEWKVDMEYHLLRIRCLPLLDAQLTIKDCRNA